jgi:selenide,water dikinase
VVCQEDEYIKVNQGQVGDLLVLTKPLGTQVAVNVNEWLINNNEKWTDKASKILDAEAAKDVYHRSVESMSHLNKDASDLMRKYDCHGATDITGFGIKGHAQNLVDVQKNNVSF